MSSASSIDFDTPEEFDDGGQFLREPGTYHLAVQDVQVGTGPKGNAIDGFTVLMEVLAGTVPSEVKKSINVTFFNPKLTAKDGGTFQRKQQSKFLIAVNLLNPASKGQRVSIDLQNAIGKQVVAAFEIDDYQQGDKKYLRLANAGMDCWHIDDPHAAGIPKNEAAIKLPGVIRHDAKWFDAIYKKTVTTPTTPVATSGNGGQKSGTPANQPATTAAAPTNRVNLDDL